MHIGMLLSHSTKAVLAFRGEPYGVEGDSTYDLYKTVLGYRLGDEVQQIRTPLLITDPEGEQFWPGQSRQLYDLLPGAKELVPFTAAEGADRHCEPMAPRSATAHLRLAGRSAGCEPGHAPGARVGSSRRSLTPSFCIAR